MKNLFPIRFFLQWNQIRDPSHLRKKDIQTNRQTVIQTDRLLKKQQNKQQNRHTDRQKKIKNLFPIRFFLQRNEIRDPSHLRKKDIQTNSNTDRQS